MTEKKSTMSKDGQKFEDQGPSLAPTWLLADFQKLFFRKITYPEAVLSRQTRSLEQ